MAEPALEVVKSLSHKLRVMRMYRYGLKELLYWSQNRHHWYPRATALRQEFEANKTVVRPARNQRTMPPCMAWTPLFRGLPSLTRPSGLPRPPCTRAIARPSAGWWTTARTSCRASGTGSPCSVSIPWDWLSWGVGVPPHACSAHAPMRGTPCRS